MKNIAVIPARGGSKRLAGKNAMLLGGIPLIAHSILTAKSNSELLHEIYISTDDAAIKGIALSYGAKVIDRPDYLSGDFEPTVSALKHVLENIDFQVGKVVLLQATNPLRPAGLIQDAFRILNENQANSLMTVTRNHQKFGKIINNMFVPFNYEIGQRSQDLEPLYFENGLLYISDAALVMNDQITGENLFPMIVDHPFAHVDIDTQADFDYAEYLFHKTQIR